MNIAIDFFLSIQFGELELSNITVILLLSISLFIFLAVAISSFKLIQSAFLPEDDE